MLVVRGPNREFCKRSPRACGLGAFFAVSRIDTTNYACTHFQHGSQLGLCFPGVTGPPRCWPRLCPRCPPSGERAWRKVLVLVMGGRMRWRHLA